MYHLSFGVELGEIIEKAQEVYVRDEIAKGLSEAATPGWDYYTKYNEDSGDRAELNTYSASGGSDEDFWFGEDDLFDDLTPEEDAFYNLIGDEI